LIAAGRQGRFKVSVPADPEISHTDERPRQTLADVWRKEDELCRTLTRSFDPW
jgi:hypothetical protein